MSDAAAGDPPPAKSSSLLGRATGLHKRKFVRETAVMQIGMFVTLATYLLTSVVLARVLGPYEFGRYTIAFTLYTFVFFVGNLGVTTTSVSRYSKACGAKDEAQKIRCLAQLLRVFFVMVVAVVLLGAAMPAFTSWYYEDAEVGWYAWALCLLGPVELTNAFMLVVLQGGRRAADYVLYDNACGATRLVVIFFALVVEPSLGSVIAAYLISGATYGAFGLRLYQLARREGDPAGSPPPLRDVVRASLRVDTEGLFSSGTMIAIGKNGAALFRSLVLLLIGDASGPAALGNFRVGFTFMWAVQQFLGGLQRAVLPALGFRLGRSGDDPAKFRRDLIRVCLGTGLLFIAVTAVLCLLAPFVLRTLYGARYAGAVDYVYVLAIGHLVLGFTVVTEAFYLFTNRVALSAKLNAAFLVVLVGMAYLLVDRYGAMGGAIVMAGSQVLGVIHLAVMGWLLRGVAAARN